MKIEQMKQFLEYLMSNVKQNKRHAELKLLFEIVSLYY